MDGDQSTPEESWPYGCRPYQKYRGSTRDSEFQHSQDSTISQRSLVSSTNCTPATQPPAILLKRHEGSTMKRKETCKRTIMLIPSHGGVHHLQRCSIANMQTLAWEEVANGTGSSAIH